MALLAFTKYSILQLQNIQVDIVRHETKPLNSQTPNFRHNQKYQKSNHIKDTNNAIKKLLQQFNSYKKQDPN